MAQALWDQLESLEKVSVAHPRMRLWCEMNMSRYRSIDWVEVELNMTAWNSTKEAARKKLEPLMGSEHQSPGEVSSATCLMKILDEYESIRGEY